MTDAKTPTSLTAEPISAPADAEKRRVGIFGLNLSIGALIAWGAVLALLVFLALGLMRSQQGPVGVGQDAPEYLLTTFSGEQISSRELDGKVVVLNFWASWCKPCEQEAADLEAAWQHYKPGGEVVFLGVDYVDTEPEAVGYLEKFAITYPNGPDLGTRISQAYRIRGVPETFVIDQNGELAAFQKGPFLSFEHIRGTIDPLLEN